MFERVASPVNVVDKADQIRFYSFLKMTPWANSEGVRGAQSNPL